MGLSARWLSVTHHLDSRHQPFFFYSTQESPPKPWAESTGAFAPQQIASNHQGLSDRKKVFWQLSTSSFPWHHGHILTNPNIMLLLHVANLYRIKVSQWSLGYIRIILKSCLSPLDNPNIKVLNIKFCIPISIPISPCQEHFVGSEPGPGAPQSVALQLSHDQLGHPSWHGAECQQEGQEGMHLSGGTSRSLDEDWDHLYEHIYIYMNIHTLHLHYITLHCITLHYTTLHYITLQNKTLHNITKHYITLQNITLHYITW
jgi:hypothetical protein